MKATTVGIDLTDVRFTYIVSLFLKTVFNIQYYPTKYGPTFRLTGEDAVIAVNSKGEVITMWKRSNTGARK